MNHAAPPASGVGRDLGARRDPAFIRAHLDELAFLFDHYHRLDVAGWEHMPAGAALAVGNHNGGIVSPDMFGFMVAFWRRFGADVPAYGLMHDVPFKVPLVGTVMARLGAVPARPGNALALLAAGAKVLVYPGGDLDAFRPSSQRGRIVFGERTGFIKIALRSGAPIVPVVSLGAHDAFHILTDGRALAQRLGLKRLLRLEVLPLGLSLPFGLYVGPGPYLPLPVNMGIRVLAPLAWPHLEPDAAADAATVNACREEVRAAMQDALSALVKEGRHGRRRLFGAS